MGLSLDDLARGITAGERPALARALSLAERDPAAASGLLEKLAGSLGRAHVVGITGPPGAGKSTLVGAMTRHFLELGQRVAVLAVDPSSPVSGGALLGDRFRIGEAGDQGRCFIRSTATRGSLGGLTAAARQMVQLMDAAGFDLVLVETVGTGQSEIDVDRLADSLLVVFPPGLGDEMQAIKAGILELADLLVVTKSDTAGARLACQALQNMAPLWRNAPPIHAVSALDGEGIAALAEAVLARAAAGAKSVRSKNDAEGVAPWSLMEDWLAIERELAHYPDCKAIDGLELQPLDAGKATATGLDLQIGFRPGSDSFRLGLLVGVLTALAGSRRLACHVIGMDAAAGRMDLQVRRTA